MHIVKSGIVALAALALILCAYAAQTARPMPTASTYPVSRAPHTVAVPASSPVRHGACDWNNRVAHVLCVGRAPRDICHAALGRRVNVCWWFVGSDTALVWDWRGDVSQS